MDFARHTGRLGGYGEIDKNKVVRQMMESDYHGDSVNGRQSGLPTLAVSQIITI
jgi:hypothetical protein